MRIRISIRINTKISHYWKGQNVWLIRFASKSKHFFEGLINVKGVIENINLGSYEATIGEAGSMEINRVEGWKKRSCITDMQSSHDLLIEPNWHVVTICSVKRYRHQMKQNHLKLRVVLLIIVFIADKKIYTKLKISGNNKKQVTITL